MTAFDEAVIRESAGCLLVLPSSGVQRCRRWSLNPLARVDDKHACFLCRVAFDLDRRIFR